MEDAQRDIFGSCKIPVAIQAKRHAPPEVVADRYCAYDRVAIFSRAECRSDRPDNAREAVAYFDFTRSLQCRAAQRREMFFDDRLIVESKNSDAGANVIQERSGGPDQGNQVLPIGPELP